VPHLILSDIKRLNLPVEDADHSKRTSNVFFPKDALLDWLEIKLGTLRLSARPDYSKAGQTTLVKKRKRGPVESVQAVGSEDEVGDENR
jgi:hypothetical protein